MCLFISLLPIFSFLANMSKPWLQQDLNLSAGIVLPMYDADTDLLFLAPRGATMLSIYDLSEQKKGGGPAFTAATNVVLGNSDIVVCAYVCKTLRKKKKFGMKLFRTAYVHNINIKFPRIRD